MGASNYTWVRYVVGGIYLLKAGLVALFAILLAVVGTVALIGEAPEGLAFLLMMAALGVGSFAYGAMGLYLIKGNRIALFLAIMFAGLGAIGYLAAGAVVPFFFEAAICAGLIMSQEVRKGYAD